MTHCQSCQNPKGHGVSKEVFDICQGCGTAYINSKRIFKVQETKFKYWLGKALPILEKN